MNKDRELLRIVNRNHPISSDYNPELVPTLSNLSLQAQPVCLNALEQMLADCRAAGMYPQLTSSYRTVQYQEKLIESYVQELMDEEGMTAEEAREKTLKHVAEPGTSEHHLGLAFDILCSTNLNMTVEQENEPTQQWLMKHCCEYGFILRYPKGKENVTGISYEPWHYRYVGKSHAIEMSKNNFTLEEYVESKNELWLLENPKAAKAWKEE